MKLWAGAGAALYCLQSPDPRNCLPSPRVAGRAARPVALS